MFYPIRRRDGTPARAMDPFTLRQIRIRHDRVKVILWNLSIECTKLRQLIKPFNLTAVLTPSGLKPVTQAMNDDDFHEIGIEMRGDVAGAHQSDTATEDTLPV